MNTEDTVAVCSRSFSRNEILRKELLTRYAKVTFNDAGASLAGDDLVKFLSGATKAITALEEISESVLSQLPNLKVIGKYGVGTDMIDMRAMRRHGKYLGWTGGVNKRSVSEMCVSLIVAMLRHLPLANKKLIDGYWKQHVGGLLSGRTVGVVGCGFVGKDLISLLRGWNCKFLAHDLLHFEDFYREHNVQPVSLKELLSLSDVVSLHLPLNESTENLIDVRHLNYMKPSAILINAARGGLVDESEIKRMLKSNRLSAAAFDVFSTEPPEDLELLSLDNFFATPHLGGSSEEAIIAMGISAINGLDDYSLPDLE